MRYHLTALLLSIAPGVGAQVNMTTKQALELAFPGCKTQRGMVTLNAAKKRQIQKISGQCCQTAMVFPYVAKKNGKTVGTAWFDVHKVRSKRQLVMVVVDPDQRVSRVEILAFAEPKRYRAPRPWLRKFHSKEPGRIRAGREVPRITGATLTVRATTRCVERILATHRVVFGKPVTPKKQSKR